MLDPRSNSKQGSRNAAGNSEFQLLLLARAPKKGGQSKPPRIDKAIDTDRKGREINRF